MNDRTHNQTTTQQRVAEAVVDLAPRNLDAADLVEAVRQRLGALIVLAIVPVKMPLLAINSPVYRAALARLLRTRFSDVAVLSFLDIPEAKKVDVIAVVGRQVRLEAAVEETGKPYAG